MRVVLALALLVGCGSDSVSEDAACKDFVQAFCTQLQTCYAPAMKIAYGDQTTCESRLLLTCSQSFHDPGTTLTTGKLDACAKKLMAISCSAVASRQLPDECKATAGPLDDGAACGDSFQCKNELCKKAKDATCGACASPGQAGASCTVSDDCDYGLVCPDAGGACVAPGAQGASCDATHPCGYGLVCDGGACAVPPGAGQKCKPDNAGGNCDRTQGLFCNPLSGVCQQFGYADAGQPCGVVNNGFSVCTAGSRCTASGLATGTCQAPAAVGAACDASNGPLCESPDLCQSGSCVLPDTTTCK